MTKRTKKPAKASKVASSSKTIAAKAKKGLGKLKQQRLDQIGVNSRVRGHVSARGKRAQAKKDAR